MKLTNKKNQEILSNNTEADSLNFGIGDVSTIIEILRNRLYSNPIQTLTQEYLSNGRDATREAGGKHPLKVTLPTLLDSVLKIRDYGVGLSPDRVKDVFVMYGASTKRKDNNQTGGFGIGAKSAWAYTDSFTIVSYHNKKEYVYIAHTGKNSNGTLEKISESATTEPNGVEIQIPVKPEHRKNFIQAVYRSTIFWKDRPQLLGITEQEIEDGYKNFDAKILQQKNNWKLLETNPFCNTLFNFNSYGSQTDLILSIDGIPYPVGKFYQNPMVSELREAFAPRSGGSFMIIEVPTGAIEVSATREAVSDREENVKSIMEVISGIKESIKTHIREQLDAQHSSLAKYIQTYVRLRNSFHAKFVPDFDFKMDDIEYKLGNYQSLLCPLLPVRAQRYSMRRQRGDRQVLSSEDAAINIITPKIQFVIRDTDDSDNKTKQKMKALLESSNKTIDHAWLINEYNADQADLILKHFEAKKLSELTFEKVKKDQKKRSEDKITVRFITVEGQNTWNQELTVTSQPDLGFDTLNANNQKYILIPFSSEDKFKNNNPTFIQMVKFLTKIGGYNVIKLSNRDYRLAQENLDSAHQYTDIEGKISDYVTIPQQTWALITEEMKFNSNLAHFSPLSNEVVDLEFREFLQGSTTRNGNNQAVNIAYEILCKFQKYLDLKEKRDKKKDQEEVFLSRYPILRRLEYRNLDYNEKKDVIEFLNFKYLKANPPKAVEKKKRTKKS